MADVAALPGAHIVVLGAGLAGMRAAQALRARGYAGRLTIADASNVLPCDRPPLSKQVLTGEWDPERAELLTSADVDALDAILLLGETAARLATGAREIEFDSGAHLGYDGLIIATGARARRITVLDGVEGVHVLRNMADALQLRAVLRQARRIAIVGMGVLGIEVASSARTLGVDVAMIDIATAPLVRVLGRSLGARSERLLDDNGITAHYAASVRQASAFASGVHLDLTGAPDLDVDVVVAAVGASPAQEWLDDSGLALGDGIGCDAFCAAAQGIYAAGDIARWHHRPLGQDIRLEHWTNAAEQGEAAAANLLLELGSRGDERLPYTPTPYVWSDRFGRRLQVVGLVEPEDDLLMVREAPDEDSFLALFMRDGVPVAGAGVREARTIAQWRHALARGAQVDEMLAVEEAVT